MVIFLSKEAKEKPNTEKPKVESNVDKQVG